MADATTIANEFVRFYYSSFDQSRASLAPVYVRSDDRVAADTRM